MTVHEVLVKARNKLSDPAVWVKGGAIGRDHRGPHCAATACGSVLPGTLHAKSADQGLWLETLRELAKAAGLRHHQRVAPWNDAPERTHEEVLAAFDKAIAATAPAPDVSFIREPVEA